MSQKAEKVVKAERCKCFAVVKVRGTVSAQREARETLELLRLIHTNHGILIPNNPSMKGMLKRVQSYVTWGEISKEMIADLLTKRGRLEGDKKLTEEYSTKVGCKSIDDLASAIADCKLTYGRLPNIQPVFKMHPPTRGYKGTTKKNFRAGGEAGYRGEAINDLIKRMI
ncbi:MAG TPA: 50S ribosomal protein L30 [Candidatus Sulfotelmatobacter sp.]|nr:50S ribosomal protein L30 [Candidatus Sulfotelmatobacter sp.]